MAKYVCDFDVAKQCITEMNNEVENLNKQIELYKDKILNSVNDWNGVASDSFRVTSDDFVLELQAKINGITRFIQFISESINKIEALENDFSNVNL